MEGRLYYAILYEGLEHQQILVYARAPGSNLPMDTQGQKNFPGFSNKQHSFKAHSTLLLVSFSVLHVTYFIFSLYSSHPKNSCFILSSILSSLKRDLYLNTLMDLILSLTTVISSTSCRCFINVSEYFKLLKLRKESKMVIKKQNKGLPWWHSG